MNLGNDSDTVGAIYGQLAGAYYGASGIPEEWRKECSFYSLIELFADELFRLSCYVKPPDLSVESNPILTQDKCMFQYIPVVPCISQALLSAPT